MQPTIAPDRDTTNDRTKPSRPSPRRRFLRLFIAALATVMVLTALPIAPASAQEDASELVGVHDDDFNVTSGEWTDAQTVRIEDTGAGGQGRQFTVWLRNLDGSCERDLEMQITNPLGETTTHRPFDGCLTRRGLLTRKLPMAAAGAGTWTIAYRSTNGASFRVPAVRIDATLLPETEEPSNPFSGSESSSGATLLGGESPATSATSGPVQPPTSASPSTPSGTNNPTCPAGAVSPVTLQLRAHLEGPYDATTSLMGDQLRSRGLVPQIDPYFSRAITDIRVFDATGNDAIVDWVVVELRQDDPKTTGVASTWLAQVPALIQRDGDIVGVDGTSPLTISVPETIAYTPIVWHRSHAPGIFASFTHAAGTVHTDTINQPLLTGDANGDHDINGNDKARWSQFNGAFGRYLAVDFNMDASVDGADKAAWSRNSGNFFFAYGAPDDCAMPLQSAGTATAPHPIFSGITPATTNPEAALFAAANAALAPTVDTADTLIQTIAPSPTGGLTEGAINGTFDVSAQGAATYQIPLFLPPGAADSRPDIGLIYDSQSGNDVAGVGWSITGIPSIARCRATQFHDGYNGAVRYDTQDRFCLNGQPLLAVSGTYGADGTTYRTEPETFVRVVSHGSAGAGPAWFTAEDGTGKTTYFGGDATDTAGRIEAANKAEVRVWAASKVVDIAGNFMTYRYHENNGSGSYQVDRIDYTGNDTVAPTNRITFVWEDRGDNTIEFQGGSVIRLDKRLDRIDISQSGTGIITSYDLDYYNPFWVEPVPNPFNVQRPLLTAFGRVLLGSITQCDGDNNCLESTKFRWDREGAAFKDVAPVAGAPTVLSNDVATAHTDIDRVKIGDFNGDGRSDVYHVAGWGGPSLDYLYFGQPDGSVSSAGVQTNMNTWVVGNTAGAASSIGQIQTGDFNCDGLTDLYLINGSSSTPEPDWIHYSNGDGTFANGITGPGTVLSAAASDRPFDIGRIHLRDFNGDGCTDVYAQGGLGIDDQLWLAIPGGGFDPAINVGQPVDPAAAAWDSLTTGISALMSFTGLTLAPKRQQVNPDATIDRFLRTTASKNRPNLTRAVSGANSRALKFGDFDGDGFLDRYVINGGLPNVSTMDQIWFGNGTGFDAPVDAVDTNINPDLSNGPGAELQPGWTAAQLSRIQIYDANGDGLSDVHFFPDTINPRETGYSVAGVWTHTGYDVDPDEVWLSKGDGTFTKLNSVDFLERTTSPRAISAQHAKTFFVDLNGDGTADRYQMFDSNDPITTIEELGRNHVDRVGYGRPQGAVTGFDRLGLRSPLFIGHPYGSQDSHWQDHLRKIHSVRFADFDGDGMADLYRIGSGGTATNGRDEIFVNRNRPGRLIEIVDGHNNEINVRYTELSANDSVYLGATSTAGHHPGTRNARPAISVVESYHRNNPLDGDYAPIEFAYRGAKIHPSLGYLGFSTHQRTDTNRNRTVLSEFNQVHPFRGQTTRSAVIDNGVTVSEQANVHETANNAIRPTSVTTTERELDGSTRSVQTQTFSQYDAYNNPVDQTVAHRDPITDTVSHEVRIETVVDNDPANWIIGRPRSITETAKAPFAADHVGTTSYIYDATGHVQSRTLTANGSQVDQRDFTYDQFGNITSETQLTTTGAQRLVRQATFSPDGRFMTTLRNALGQESIFTHDPRTGQQTGSTDPNGLTAQATFDGFGRETSTTGTDGVTSHRYYEDNQQIFATTPPAGTVSQMSIAKPGTPGQMIFLDSVGRELRRVTPGVNSGELIFVDTRYDSLGRTDGTTLPYFGGEQRHWTTIGYDDLDRVVSTVTADGATTTTEHFGAVPSSELQGTSLFGAYPGLTKSVTTNDLGQSTTSYLNLRGEPVQILDAANFETSYLYDAVGQLVDISDPEGNTTTFTFNGAGNVVTEVDPDRGTINRTYDDFEQLTSITDASGTVTSYTYDPVGRILTETDTDGVTTFEYDVGTNAVGRLTSVTHPNGSESYVYDSAGRLTSTQTQIGGDTWVNSIGFDDFGRPNFIIEPHHPDDPLNTWLYTWRVYSSSGHLEQVRNFPMTADQSFEIYWKLSSTTAALQPRETEVAGSGTFGPPATSITRTYDPLTQRLNRLAVGDSGALLHHEYTHDSIGNLTSRDDLLSPAKVEQFGYDNRNRLTSVTTQDATGFTHSATYSYDSIGNIYSRSDVAAGATYIYGQNGAGPRAVTAIGTTSYAYDANGNMTNNDGQSMTWNAAQKVATISAATGATATFLYDHADQLIERTDGDGTRHAFVGSLEARTETDGSQELRYSIMAGEEQVAHHSVLLDSNGTATGRRTVYLVGDHLGSTALTLDATGSVLSNLSYDAFGARRNADWSPTAASAPTETDIGFNGHRQLDDIGLVNMRARMYDPAIGRFISPDSMIPDPTNLQTLNRYSYVNNNPVSFIDPSGHCAQDPGATGWDCVPFGDSPDGSFTGSLPSVAPDAVGRSALMDDELIVPPGSILLFGLTLYLTTGEPRHLSGVPDAIGVEIQGSFYAAWGGQTSVVGILVLTGPDAGMFQPFLDVGTGFGFDNGVDLVGTAFYYSGDAENLGLDDFAGFRTSYGASVNPFPVIPHLHLSGGFSLAPADTDHAMLGFSFGAGFDITPIPLPLGFNANAGASAAMMDPIYVGTPAEWFDNAWNRALDNWTRFNEGEIPWYEMTPFR